MYKRLESGNQLEALPLDECFAKTFVNIDGATLLGRTVLEHCCIVGEVAGAITRLYPTFLREEYFPAGTSITAGAHDVGKVSPAMQEKLRRATDDYQDNSLPELANKGIANPDSSDINHAIISEAALRELSPEGWLAKIAGMHHGRRAENVLRSTAEIYGGPPWQARRVELLNQLKTYFDETYPLIEDRTKAWVLAGLTTVADWIGSGSFFESPDVPWQGVIEEGVANAGFVEPSIKSGLSFKDIFNYTPYPVQSRLAEICQQPGVYILEAPMGLGKTEAALYAAYRMLETNQATGIYFALPTRFTSNKIYERFTPFLNAILEADSPHRTALLLHGTAHLQQFEMGADAAPGQAWFCSLKRAILAPFGVGTIDQALVSVLPDKKHSFVRTFGLLGKVVILDEVHTYDTYTGVILDSLIEQLRQLSCTIIILSATVTQNRRQLILGAAPKKQSYPLISTLEKNGNIQEHELESLQNRCVHLHLCEQRSQALSEALARAHDGQQVLWIENTVAEAQEVYRLIKAAGANIESGLVHSRFLQKDREQHETNWIHFFGKDGSDVRYAKGRILVGTQVLEQSLDIDADFLVSQVCPTDMFLQRLGRLWRHNLANRHPDAKPDVFLLIPQGADTAVPSPCFFGRTGYVYDPYILYRSLEVIRGYKDILLPAHIRPMLEATYSEREEQGALAKLKTAFLRTSEKFARLAAVAMSEMGQKERDTTPCTRYSEVETCPVLLAKSITHDSKSVTVTFLDGTKSIFPRHVKKYNKQLWRSLAVTLSQNTVTVIPYQAPKPCTAGWLSTWLKEYVYLGSDNSAFRVALVTEAGELQTLDRSSVNDTYTITYTHHIGYNSQKTEEGR